jgi:hypothetical protein
MNDRVVIGDCGGSRWGCAEDSKLDDGGLGAYLGTGFWGPPGCFELSRKGVSSELKQRVSIMGDLAYCHRDSVGATYVGQHLA